MGSKLTRINGSYRKSLGVSLAETVISLGLLGIVLIPSLFVSSAWFNQQLMMMRENMRVVHSASQFMNGFLNELSKAQTILPDSTATEVHFTYYDPVKQERTKRGYRLTDDSGTRYMERLQYNESASNWLAISPYATEEATSIRLPATAEFKYCQGSVCTVNPERALYVQLTDFDFSGTSGQAKTLTLPSTLNLYMATDVQSSVTVSSVVKQLFTMAGGNAFDGASDLTLAYLAPNGQNIATLDFSGGGGGAGTGLSVLVSNAASPGYVRSGIASSTGRIFFGESAGGSDNWWTWLESDGLSILSTTYYNYERQGVNSTIVTSSGRLFTGHRNNSGGTLRTYDVSSNAYNTILSGGKRIGGDSSNSLIAANSASGRVVAIERRSCPCRAVTWTSTDGLSIIRSDMDTDDADENLVFDSTDGRFYFADATPGGGNVYSWKEGSGAGTGLSIIASNTADTGGGAGGLLIAGSGRVVFGEDHSSGNAYTWSESDGLSILLTGANVPVKMWGSRFGPSGLPYRNTDYTDSDGRVYFNAGNNPGQFYAWHSTDGLSVITSSYASPGTQSTAVYKAGNRVYFAASGQSNPWPDYFLTWNKTSGLSVIVSGARPPTAEDYAVDAIQVSNSSGRVFFSRLEGSSNGKVFTWMDGAGLSVIASGLSKPGYSNMVIHQSNERLYFRESGQGGGSSAPYKAFTWQASSGLSLIISGLNSGGANNTFVNPITGGLYFGDSGTGSDSYYYYDPGSGGGSSSGTLYRASHNGVKTGQTYSIEYDSNTYSAIAQDATGKIYAVDTTNDQLKRFTYDSANTEFDYQSALNFGTWTPNATAIAVDDGGTGFALIDSVNTELDIYADRSVVGVPAAPTQIDLTALATAVSTPTGLAVNGRTGDYLVLDSDQQAGNIIRLFVISSAGSLKEVVNIDLDDITPDATSETNFKILYNDQTNLLYLMAPSLNSGAGQIYGLSLPSYLK